MPFFTINFGEPMSMQGGMESWAAYRGRGQAADKFVHLLPEKMPVRKQKTETRSQLSNFAKKEKLFIFCTNISWK
jgi:hypothetical protein